LLYFFLLEGELELFALLGLGVEGLEEGGVVGAEGFELGVGVLELLVGLGEIGVVLVLELLDEG
jgi:hypothetical protein